MKNNEYNIPERYKIMANYASMLAYKAAKRLSVKSDESPFCQNMLVDYPDFIEQKLSDINLAAHDLVDAINEFEEFEDEFDIKYYIEELREHINGIIDIIDEIRCTYFNEGYEEAKLLLICLPEKIVRDAILMLQELHIAALFPEEFIRDNAQHSMRIELFINFQVDEELSALEAWVKKQNKIERFYSNSQYSWGALLATFTVGFGLGWRLSRD